ncbi:MAG: 50S ribosomal protein L29 [Verrucomicrobia bacterium]|nr:50S ribosomal protein L29 [Verrucomicrobiota bacterium]MDE3046757.1 50S ribosomal protein L29 [Verrucomicrobiota bacterium]
MAKKKKEIQDQSEKEMIAAIHDLDRELFALRNELATQRKLEKPHLIKEKRRQKARLLTIMTQKQREAV